MIKTILTVKILCLLTTLALGLSEKQLEDPANVQRIKDFYLQGAQKFITNKNGVRLNTRSFENPDAKISLILLPGRTEPIMKYDEVVYDFYHAGYSVYLLDWTGQGASDRLLDNRSKGHIEHYAQYLLDLEQFMTDIITPRHKSEFIPIGHSMGANILSRFLAKYPNVFEKAILSSPMLDIPTPYGEFLTRSILKFMIFFGHGDDYVPGHGSFNPKEPNDVTTSVPRRSKEMAFRTSHPQLRVAGATYSWVHASLNSTQTMRKDAEKIKSKILLLQAGRDQIVLSKGQDHVCELIEFCKKINYPTAQHEILHEVDSIRDKAFADIYSFINDQTAVP